MNPRGLRDGATVFLSMRRVMVFVTVTLVAAAAPAGALAQGGVDEYVEQFPGPGGGGDASGGDEPDGPLTTEQVSALEEQGADGAAVAALAEGNDGDGEPRPGDDERPASRSTPDDSGVTGMVSGIAGDSGEGIGIALPIALGATVIAAAAFFVVRLRGGRNGPT